MDPLFRQIGPVIALERTQAIEVFGGPNIVVIVMNKYPWQMGVTYEVKHIYIFCLATVIPVKVN
jgi:hypothetical protein